MTSHISQIENAEEDGIWMQRAEGGLKSQIENLGELGMQRSERMDDEGLKSQNAIPQEERMERTGWRMEDGLKSPFENAGEDGIRRGRWREER